MHEITITVTALAVALATHGCTAATQIMSERSVEDKVNRLKIGLSTQREVEAILGTDRSNDGNRWMYNLSDSAFTISEHRQGSFGRVLPIKAELAPVNTRAIIAVSFNEVGVINRLEVERFFNEPFINDYSYTLRDSAKDPLKSIAAMAEDSDFKIVDFDQDTGTFALEEGGSSARITIRVEGQTLRITTTNPHPRLTNEYRVFAKRETALMRRLANSDLVQ
jgi:hypothetical protein